MTETSFTPHIMIVESRFYPDIADELARGAITQLESIGATYKRCPVPTLFEVPVAMRYAIRAIELFPARKRFDGYIALGCAIRDEHTPRDLLSGECTHTVLALTVQFSLATGFGVIAVDTREEAWTRASIKKDDYGGQAAKTCLDMIQLKTEFKLFPRSQ
jgi:6,7-dimethyl-8-ribityllumazine synthase